MNSSDIRNNILKHGQYLERELERYKRALELACGDLATLAGAGISDEIEYYLEKAKHE